MKRLPKFLEADNPNDPDGLTFIIHTQPPRFAAQVIICQGEEYMEIQRHFAAYGRTDYGDYSAVIGIVEMWDSLPTGTPQDQADLLAKIMRRCADWYRGVLIDIINES